MTCDEAQDRRLEGLDISEHLALCPSCREIEALDEDFRIALTPPVVSADFRANLRRRIRQDRRREVSVWLPDVSIVVGGVAATAACVLATPLPAPYVWVLGSLLTLAAYLLQTIVVSLLEGAD